MTGVIDISLPIHSGMMVFPGDPPVTLERTKTLAHHGVNLSHLSFGTHTGTHIDAPLHFVNGGAAIDAIPPEVFIGPARVIEIAGDAPRDAITSTTLERSGVPLGTSRLLLKTANSALWASARAFPEHWVALGEDAARWVVDRGIRLIGIDFLSIEHASADHPVHRILLEAGVIILEGLDLSLAAPGKYTLVCVPLRLTGADGSPARALLLNDRA